MTIAAALTGALRRILDLILLVLVLIVLVSLAVARLVPAATGAPTFVVGSGSMEPALPIGSVVVDVRVAAADLREGDVVSLKAGPQQAVFTHRILRLVERNSAEWIETKGDANATADPSIIPATAVTGRVAAVIPYLGYPIQLLSSLAGVAFLLSVAMVTLLAAWLLETLQDDQRAWVRRRRLEQADLVPADVVMPSGAAG